MLLLWERCNGVIVVVIKFRQIQKKNQKKQNNKKQGEQKQIKKEKF